MAEPLKRISIPLHRRILRDYQEKLKATQPRADPEYLEALVFFLESTLLTINEESTDKYKTKVIRHDKPQDYPPLPESSED